MTDDEHKKAEDVFVAMKYGTSMCVVCRFNFPAYGKVKIEGLSVGYCRSCVVGVAKIRGHIKLEDAEKYLVDVIRLDGLEYNTNVLKLREAQEKIRAKRQRDS